jgi:5-methylcytosine-specific restriction protein A
MRPRILKRDRNICQLCGVVKLPRFLDVDHIMPRIAGGTDDPSNLRTLCRPCHKARRTGQPRPEPPRPTSRLPVIRGTMTKAS